MAGANGVILVTTKKGKSGQLSFEYNGYVGFQNPTTIVDMVNAYDYVRLRNIADRNADQGAPFLDDVVEGFRKSVEGTADADYDKYPNTNAMDAIRNKNNRVNQPQRRVFGRHRPHYLLHRTGLPRTGRDVVIDPKKTI